jgi:hypothetical protein
MSDLSDALEAAQQDRAAGEFLRIPDWTIPQHCEMCVRCGAVVMALVHSEHLAWHAAQDRALRLLADRALPDRIEIDPEMAGRCGTESIAFTPYTREPGQPFWTAPAERKKDGQ